MIATTRQNTLRIVLNCPSDSIDIEDLPSSKKLKEALGQTETRNTQIAIFPTKCHKNGQTFTLAGQLPSITPTNFDESSAAWMENKHKLANGQYKYVCGKLTKNRKKCKNPTNCHLHK